MKKIMLVVALGGLLFLIISSILEMPSYGEANNPSYNEVAKHYINHAIEETNSPNVVSAIITDYRAFDTLGETTVLFTSIAAVLSVLAGGSYKDKEEH